MNYLFDNLIKKLIFGKAWSSLVWEPNPIKIRTKENHKIDHEGKFLLNLIKNIFFFLVELGFVISKKANKIKKEEFLDYIEAYFLCLDLTDRNFLQGKISKF
jgi:2-keto-4-pentenoate hydratase/2-oxohepta-3-ene-1,7-dioic acid hydratase in catechol pathway